MVFSFIWIDMCFITESRLSLYERTFTGGTQWRTVTLIYENEVTLIF